MAERRPDARGANFRRGAPDDLGLRRALGDGVLPLLVGAMAFLAALAGAGAVGARALARHWQSGAASALTVQVPRPEEIEAGEARLQRAVAVLRGDPAVASARPLDAAALDRLLRPWFGPGGPPPGLALPGVIAVRLTGPSASGEAPDDGSGLAGRLRHAVPGTEVEGHALWVGRLAALADSLQACAWLALAVVATVAVLVIAVATRSGLVARREAIGIVHGLGATDGYIAWRFARRATALAAGGAALGAVAVLPVLLGLAALAAPFAQPTEAAAGASPVLAAAAALPAGLWLALPALPAAAAAIGFVTAQGTVRLWLRRLP